MPNNEKWEERFDKLYIDDWCLEDCENKDGKQDQSLIKDFIREQLTLARREEQQNKEEVLTALAYMYDQYCSKDGHKFMTAGEHASEVLERYGYLQADGTGRGEIHYDESLKPSPTSITRNDESI